MPAGQSHTVRPTGAFSPRRFLRGMSCAPWDGAPVPHCPARTEVERVAAQACIPGYDRDAAPDAWSGTPGAVTRSRITSRPMARGLSVPDRCMGK